MNLFENLQNISKYTESDEQEIVLDKQTITNAVKFMKDAYHTYYENNKEISNEIKREIKNTLNTLEKYADKSQFINESMNDKNHDMESIKSYWAYKEIVEHDYQVEITDNSLTIRFPKPDNDIYAHYTFRYDEDFEDWLVYFHGDKPERKGELIIDELESISSYESVVKGCLYNFWNTH